MKNASKIILIVLVAMFFISGCNKNDDVLYEKDGVSIKIENLEEIKFIGKEINDFSYWEKMHSDGTMNKLQTLAKNQNEGIVHIGNGYFAGVQSKNSYNEEEDKIVSQFDTYIIEKNKWIVASADINYTEQDLDSMKNIISEYLELNKDVKIKEDAPVIEFYPVSVNALDTDYKVMFAIQ